MKITSIFLTAVLISAAPVVFAAEVAQPAPLADEAAAQAKDNTFYADGTKAMERSLSRAPVRTGRREKFYLKTASARATRLGEDFDELGRLMACHLTDTLHALEIEERIRVSRNLQLIVIRLRFPVRKHNGLSIVFVHPFQLAASHLTRPRY